jgi:ketosteroid isomerase-like protein
MSALETAKAFVEAINSCDADRLAEWMTEDHIFVDSDGQKYPGRERMRNGWRDYFSMVPDYKIEIIESFEQDHMVVFLGNAEGTFSEGGKLEKQNHWKVPAAWRAVVEGRKVALWQVYVNPEPMNKIVLRIKDTETSKKHKRKSSQ